VRRRRAAGGAAHGRGAARLRARHAAPGHAALVLHELVMQAADGEAPLVAEARGHGRRQEEQGRAQADPDDGRDGHCNTNHRRH